MAVEVFRPSLRPSLFESIEERARRGELGAQDALALWNEPSRLCALADEFRRETNGDIVTFVVNRNINFTNICTGTCSFCSFSRERPFLLREDEIRRKVEEALDFGATEICMQGGLLPRSGVEEYCRLLELVRSVEPELHLHCFSPEEIRHMCRNSGVTPEEALRELRRSGLGSIPGTAAEIFSERVRAIICPEKLSAAEWFEIVGTAHRLNIPTTSTMLYGHVESVAERVDHLMRLRELQRATGGINEFIPLPYQGARNPLAATCNSPGAEESRRTHALARVLLHRAVPNIQASWVKLGPEEAQRLLHNGVNDLGGTLMEENISRAAGSEHGQCMTQDELARLIEGAGRKPMQRTTLYQLLPVPNI